MSTAQEKALSSHGGSTGGAETTAEMTSLAGRIRLAIVHGDFVPQQRLIEMDLCQQYGASRGAVRAALQELAAAGLVELMRNKGAKVRSVSLEEAIEITEVRMMLEGLSAAKAAELVTDEEADELRAIGEGMRTAVDRRDYESYSEFNAALHATVRRIARHETSRQILDRLGAQVVRYQYRLSRRPSRPEVSLPQHEAIIAAIVRHDADGAMRAMQLHLDSVRAALVETDDPLLPAMTSVALQPASADG